MVDSLFRTAMLIAVVIATLNYADSTCAQTVNDNGLWFASFNTGKLSELGVNTDDRWLMWFDAHARFLNDADGFNQSIIRPGLGIKTGEDSALWAGYGWINTSPVGGDKFDENRFWQQWTWMPSCCDWAFQVRSRFEQRWLETGDDVGLRWRQLSRIQKRLVCCPRMTAVAWDEIFFNLNDTDWGAEAGLDQNRIFVGFGYKPNPDNDWRVEIGYLNQAINRPGDPDQANHIISINFFR